jgi:PAS domain S-box-containing protein
MSIKTKSPLTGVARTFQDDQLIVTKTDPKGIITYANRTFVDISGYTEAELLGKPHNMIRHPKMPRAVFKLLWDRLKANEEIFAFVCNRCKNGDHYWVLAHVTPNFDAHGTVLGFHSSRRNVSDKTLEVIEPLYQRLHDIETQEADRKVALENSVNALHDEIQRLGYASYDRFVLAHGR